MEIILTNEKLSNTNESYTLQMECLHVQCRWKTYHKNEKL